MINHQYKCIFIHIPRCAGTFIELAIDKRDWWNVDYKKNIYQQYAQKNYIKNIGMIISNLLLYVIPGLLKFLGIFGKNNF